MVSIAQSNRLAIPYMGKDHPQKDRQTLQQDAEDAKAQTQNQNNGKDQSDHANQENMGSYARYQAHIIGAQLAASHDRHKAKTSPREAARAYGQARRRPIQVSERPRLRTIM
ncbi:MAG: hypothetical protein OIF54_07035 [Cohaesibacter sp.]|nr:hypothetical protein [Cohaesibacter sp.]